MNTRFNTRYDRVTPFTKETIVGPSETRPDESLSIPEILSKYIRGQRIDVSFPGGYDSDEDGNVPFEDEFSPSEPQDKAASADPAANQDDSREETSENSTK